jgi:hypothetical protein
MQEDGAVYKMQQVRKEQVENSFTRKQRLFQDQVKDGEVGLC